MMQQLTFQEAAQVAGGDRWCDTPEGKSNATGGAAGQNGPKEVCMDAGFRINGKEIEICIITRTDQ